MQNENAQSIISWDPDNVTNWPDQKSSTILAQSIKTNNMRSHKPAMNMNINVTRTVLSIRGCGNNTTSVTKIKFWWNKHNDVVFLHHRWRSHSFFYDMHINYIYIVAVADRKGNKIRKNPIRLIKSRRYSLWYDDINNKNNTPSPTHKQTNTFTNIYTNTPSHTLV